MNYPGVDEVISAIAKTTESVEVKNLLQSFGASAEHLQPYPGQVEGRRLWADMDRGIQLEFKDVGLLEDIPYHDLEEGPWVLTQIIFWSDVESENSYAGDLPFGIDFGMTREQVRSLFSVPPATSSERVDGWPQEGYRLLVNYEPKSKRIRSVGIQIFSRK